MDTPDFFPGILEGLNGTYNESTQYDTNTTCEHELDQTIDGLSFLLDCITILSNLLILGLISFARMEPTSIPLQSQAVTEIINSAAFVVMTVPFLMCTMYIRALIAFSFSNSSHMLAVSTFILYLTLCRNNVYKRFGSKRNIVILTVSVAVWNVLIGALTFFGQHETPFSFKGSDLWIGMCLIFNIFVFPAVLSIYSHIAILRYRYVIWKSRVLLTENMKKNLMLVAFLTTLIVLYNATLLPLMICIALKYNGYHESETVALIEKVFIYLNYINLFGKDFLFIYMYLTFRRNRERSLWL